MRHFLSGKVFIFIEILGMIINVVIALLTDIAMHETTSMQPFNLKQLFANPFFKVGVVLLAVYAIIFFYINLKVEKNDKRLKDAIENGQIKLISQVVTYTENKDFESAINVIEILDKLDERRKQ